MPTNPSALPTIPPFPALSDRAAGTYNSKAYTWATEWDTIIAPALETLAETTYDNAVEAAASSTLAVQNTGTAIGYTFDTATADADPGAGKLRLNNATQNTATVIRADNTSAAGSDVAALLATFGTGTSTVKGRLRIQHATDATKWLIFDVTAVASPSGYKNITATCTGFSAASPFANGDALAVSFSTTGDKGDTGATGPAGTFGGTATSTAEFLTGANIASASTVNLDTATGNRVHITGTTTITGWTLTRGPRTVIFDGALQLTYNATTNRLNSNGANVTVEAGDMAYIESDGTTVYVNVIKKNGAAVAASDQTFGSLATAAVVQAAAPSTGSPVQVVALTASKHVCAWVNSGGSVLAAVVDVSGSTCTPGSVATVGSGTGTAGYEVSLIALTASEALAAFYDTTNNRVTTVVLSVSGSTITVNTPQHTTSDGGTSLSLAYLSATLALLFWCDSSNYVAVRAVSIATLTSITLGAKATVYNASTASAVRACGLTATKAVVTYFELSSIPTASVVDVSGTTCTAGTFQGGNSVVMNALGNPVPLSSSRVYQSLYSNQNTSNGQFGRVLDVSGTAITYGEATDIGGTQAGARLYCLKVAADRVLNFQKAPSPAVQALSVNADGFVSVRTRKGLIPYNASSTFNLAASIATAPYALLFYLDVANSSYPTVRVLDLGTATA